MIPAALSRTREPAVTAEEHSDYFATEPHYLSLAKRILTALPPGGSFVLVTGDPPAVPQLLSRALRKSTWSRHTVIDVACHAELTSEELSRASSVFAILPSSETPAESQSSAPGPPIFVFAAADRLPEERIRQIVEFIENTGQRGTTALLLAHSGFLARLDEEALQFLRERLVARFELQEVGEDEGIEFLRHQLAARHARGEAPSITPGPLRGLAATGVLLALAIGAFLLLENHSLVGEPSARSDRQEAAASRSTPSKTPAPVAANLPATAAAPQPVPLTQETPPHTDPGAVGTQATLPTPEPTATPPLPGGQHMSSTEIAALVTRGDRFLGAGDITSARLFYERAADAGSAAAALRLGATFDPGFLRRAGIRGVPGDATQAASWYRRARDLGDPAAADWLESLDGQRVGESRSLPR